MINNENNKNQEEKQDSKNVLALIRGEEGNGFIEKILIIALFAFVVSAAVSAIGGSANDKLQKQSDNLAKVNDTCNGC